MAEPLRKKQLDSGKVYTRVPQIQQKLEELLALPREQVLLRSTEQDDTSPGYVPTECLVYLVRACREEDANPFFEGLYKALLERIIRTMPSGESKDGKRIALEESRIQEEVLDRFRELLARDRRVYEERLDFYEVRFGMALKRLKLTVEREVRADMKPLSPLENPDTGEIGSHVEEAVGLFNPFDSQECREKDYRVRLSAAINSLTLEQKRIVTMHSSGIPFDSKDPNAVTIAKALKLSDKTVRTRYREALAKLKRILEKGASE